MIVKKTNPVGVDKQIDVIQQQLYDGLLSWQAAIHGYECYHRAYKNETENGLIPEVLKRDDHYQEVFMNDRFSATSFFLVSDERNKQGENLTLYTLETEVIFQVKLKELYPLINHRADEEAHQQVMNVLHAIQSPLLPGYRVGGLTVGINNVYSGFDTSKIKYTDMEPFHVFKVGLTTDFLYCTN